MKINTAKTIFGDVQPGDWVIAAGNNDYRYLIGMVTEIDKPGTPDHDTENETDDIHVDFTVFDYPQERISEIENHFTGLYGEPKIFDELAIDNVIMAPDMLIRITHLGQDEISFIGNLRKNCESFCNCFPGGVNSQSEKHAELIERVNKNLADYHDFLESFGTRELIGMAGKINAMSDAHLYITSWHRFDDGELDVLLQFQNPLEIVADEWCDRCSDLSDMSFTVALIERQKDDFFATYSLMKDLKAPQDASSDILARKIPDKPAEVRTPIEKAEQTAVKPKQSLADKLQAANKKVKAQDTQNNNKQLQSRKREERG
ncbi:MAG: hypothetical protein FWF15_00070 [Oscillospiraceae bacterium]|nr:hypothetical protein [Oscillospiraceae bacterium]